MMSGTSRKGGLGLRIEEFTSIDNRPGWCSASPVELHGELTDRTKDKPFLARHWSTLARILSLVLVITLWSLVLLLLRREKRDIGYYLVSLSSIVTFFETMFITHRVFCGNEKKDTRLHRIWDFLLNINTWKRLLMYVLLSIPAFLRPSECPITLGCGILINLIGILDFIHLFRERNERKPIRYRQLGTF